MAIWVTGDIHGNPNRLGITSFPEQKEMTKEDYVIILGDFGIIWDHTGETPSERYWLKWLENRPFTTLFIDGNHENFERLYEYPEKDFQGGRVHEIRPSVLHLMRGEVFDLCDKKIFTFGGARSHDIQDGILDPVEDAEKIRKWNYDYSKLFRINGISWWKEEMPSEEEMQHGMDSLDSVNWNVDYIISHDCPTSTFAELWQKPCEGNELNTYLEDIKRKCNYSQWLFGHHHYDKKINEKDIVLYEQIVRIA